MKKGGSGVSKMFEIGSDLLRVKRLGFGAMHLRGPGVRGEPEGGERLGALRRAVKLGINPFNARRDTRGPEGLCTKSRG